MVPKPLRDALRLTAGQELELEVRDGRLEIEIAPTPMRLQGEGIDVYAVTDEPMPVLTAQEVRRVLDQVRR